MNPGAMLLAAAGIALAAGHGSSTLRGLHVTMHTVRAGETVASIVQTYATSRGAIESLNPGINLDNLKTGDVVKILSRAGVFQKLNAGFTLYDVARAYQVKVDELLRANEITNPRRIHAGQEIFVPDVNPLSAQKRKRLMQSRRPVNVRVKGAIGNPLGTADPLVRSDSYGRRRHPITGALQMHSGVDLVAPWGTPVLAVLDGTVSYAGWKGGYGKLVVLDHAKNMQTCYAHVTEILVKEGMAVKEGDIIAKVGATGDVTAPHLHFELRIDGNPRNPLRYLQRYF